MISEKAHAVRFVHQPHRAVLLGDGDHLLQWRDIAQHRIDALEDDELARFGGKPAEALVHILDAVVAKADDVGVPKIAAVIDGRSEEHTSELQSLMRISYAVFCWQKKRTIGYREESSTKICAVALNTLADASHTVALAIPYHAIQDE